MSGTYTCATGCPSQIAPVCTSLGITAAHECIALCQGAEVVSPGPCPKDTTTFQAGPAKAAGVVGGSSQTVIASAVINKYSKAGYMYVGRAAFTKKKPRLGSGLPLVSNKSMSAAVTTASVRE
jgi:hypothetical protein